MRMLVVTSWNKVLTDEKLKQMKKLLIIAPWTELDLRSEEKTIIEEREERN